ncbi:MAG: endolytic transglycosylase MltG [Marinicella sp.]
MKKILTYGFLLLAALALAVLAYLYKEYKTFLQQPVFSDVPTTLEIKKGDTFTSFVKLVKNKGGRGSDLNWKLMAKFNHLENSIKTGEFEIAQTMNPLQLVQYIADNNVKTYSITLIEGHSWKQIKQQLLGSELKHVLLDVTDEQLVSMLEIEPGYLEGQFLPETYQYVKGDLDIDILTRAHEALKATLQHAWENRSPDIKLKSSYEMLILASIIEKETAQNSERNIISGVFHRRLSQGIRLQTDPTVIYGVGDAYAGDITSAHLRTDTPYNTYTRKGLPPTPIAMPSSASIEAAGHPNDGNELYFVANNKGGHTFSDTYEEHEKAVAAYLKGL